MVGKETLRLDCTNLRALARHLIEVLSVRGFPWLVVLLVFVVPAVTTKIAPLGDEAPSPHPCRPWASAQLTRVTQPVQYGTSEPAGEEIAAACSRGEVTEASSGTASEGEACAQGLEETRQFKW